MPHETWPTYETRDPADPANMIYGYKRDDGDIHWEIRHPDCSTTIIGTLNDMADAKARLIAERDQHRARQDELVTEHPELKSRSRRTR